MFRKVLSELRIKKKAADGDSICEGEILSSLALMEKSKALRLLVAPAQAGAQLQVLHSAKRFKLGPGLRRGDVRYTRAIFPGQQCA